MNKLTNINIPYVWGHGCYGETSQLNENLRCHEEVETYHSGASCNYHQWSHHCWHQIQLILRLFQCLEGLLTFSPTKTVRPHYSNHNEG